MLSIEILPILEAKARPAGDGRKDPNQFPYLPPPTGRIKWGSLCVCCPVSFSPPPRVLLPAVTAELPPFLSLSLSLFLSHPNRWNPLYVLSAFCGPKLLKRVGCCLIFLALIAVMVFGSPAVGTVADWVFKGIELPEPLNYVAIAVFALLILCCCCCCVYCCRTCRKLSRAGVPDDEEDDGVVRDTAPPAESAPKED